MEQQTNMFEVDMTGRKAKKLGLSPDHKIVVTVLDEASRLHSSLARYQIGIVDCEMKRLGADDKAAELTRLWNDAFMAFTNLGEFLRQWEPVNAMLESQINAEAAAKAKAAKTDGIDDEFNRFMGGSGPAPEGGR